MKSNHMKPALALLILFMICLLPFTAWAENKEKDLGTLKTDGEWVSVSAESETTYRYKMEIPENGKLDLNASSSGEKLVDIKLLDQDEMVLLHSYTLDLRDREMYILKGTYYVDFFTEDPKVKLRAVFTPTQSPEKEPNNSREQAIPLTPYTEAKGFVTQEDDSKKSIRKDNEDWYCFTLEKKDEISLDLHFEEYTGMAALYDKELRELKTVYKMQYSDQIADQPIALEAGTYYIKVTAWDIGKGGIYYLTLESANMRKVSKVSGLKLKAGKKKITASWKKLSGVDGYQIYVSQKKGSGYKKTATVKSASSAKTVLKKIGKKKLRSGKKYYVKVRAYKVLAGKTFTGPFSKAVRVKVR